jgi:hypothetical protein
MFDVTIEEPQSLTRENVRLRGTVNFWPGEYQDDDLSGFAVIPFVWEFGPVQHETEGHGWRPAGSQLFYDVDSPNQRESTWTVNDAMQGRQHAVIVVARGEVQQQYFTALRPATIHTMHDSPGTLPRGGAVRGGPKFTVSPPRIQIATVPDSHLTGAVFGVGRAASDDPWPAAHVRVDPKFCFRVIAWAKSENGTLFVGERRCHVSGYWTFDDLVESQRNADTYQVALVEDDYEPPPAAPQETGHGVVSIDEHEHQPPHRHGAGTVS